MVRLKVEVGQLIYAVAEEFQFLMVRLKASKTSIVNKFFPLISIPYGAIKRNII